MQTKKKILIVDEDSNYIVSLRKGLNQAGYEVVYWDDGKKALELSKNIRPDLIITEVNMPQMNGHEFYNEIKNVSELRNIPFIFLSSQKRVDDRIKSMELGVDDFLVKPFYVDEVVARIESLLNEVASLEEIRHHNEKGFSGDISEMNLVDLIQTLELGKKSGIIKMKFQKYNGNVFVKNGEVIDADLEKFSPKDAILKMAVWTEGSFFVEMTDVTRDKTLTQKNKDLISEALKRINRWEQAKKNLPPLSTIIAVNNVTVNENNITDDEKKLISSLNGDKMLYDIIVKSSFDDLKALEIVDHLYQKGYLQETINNVIIEPENYLSRIKQDSQKFKSSSERVSYLISNLLHSSREEEDINFDSRRDERRQFSDRRKFERRRDRRIQGSKIYLDKTELLMIREKSI